jgi:hypothetical protein
MHCTWRNHSYLCIRYATHLDRPLDYCTEDGTSPRYCTEVPPRHDRPYFTEGLHLRRVAFYPNVRCVFRLLKSFYYIRHKNAVK